MTFKIQTSGWETVTKNLRILRATYPRAVNAAMFTEAVATGREIYPLIPIRTGRLRDSFGVTEPRKRGNRVVCYTGVGAPYGLHVHERTDIGHKSPTRAKFIEVVYRRRRTGYNLRIAILARKYIRDKTTVTGVASPFPRKIKDPGVTWVDYNPMEDGSK